jgi:hypothetical protein
MLSGGRFISELVSPNDACPVKKSHSVSTLDP